MAVAGFPHQTIDSMLNDGVTDERLTDNACYQEIASSTDIRKLVDDGEKVLLIYKYIF